MAYLPHFNYDVFMSYGWGGTADPNLADRAWVLQFRNALEQELNAELPGGQARIFLDSDVEHEGKTWPWLSAAIRSSALLLFVVSPGSIRPEGMCLRELDEFVAHGGAFGEPPDNQIYVAIIRGAPEENWPDVLKDQPRHYFGDRDGLRFFQADINDLRSASTTAGRALRVLAQNIRDRLQALRKEIARTVYLASTSPAQRDLFDRLQRELTRPDRRKRLLSSAATNAGDASRLIRWCSISIHILDQSYQSGDALQRCQLEQAQEWFQETRQSIFIWPAPAWNMPAGMQSRFMPVAEFVQQGFEFFESVISQQVESARIPSDHPRKGSPEERFVYVHCVEQDLDKIESLRSKLNSLGIELRTPLFSGGNEEERFAEDISFVQEEFCYGAAVYYGTREDLEVYRTCNKLHQVLQASGKPRALLVNPPQDKKRRAFRHPGFRKYECPDDCRPDDLREFADRVLGR